MRRYIIVLLSMLAICSVPCQSQTIDRALFERMVAITKHFEGNPAQEKMESLMASFQNGLNLVILAVKGHQILLKMRAEMIP